MKLKITDNFTVVLTILSITFMLVSMASGFSCFEIRKMYAPGNEGVPMQFFAEKFLELAATLQNVSIVTALLGLIFISYLVYRKLNGSEGSL